MAKIRARKTKEASEAGKRGKFKQVLVPSPYGHGFDKVARLVDTIDCLYRRKQISQRQRDAALRYRLAFETQAGSIKSSLATEGFYSPAPPGPRTPSSPLLAAAENLREAKKVLGLIDHTVVELIAGKGYSIEKASLQICERGEKGRVSDTDVRAVGRRLRDGLEVLALRWFGPDRKRQHGAWTPDWARPEVITRWGEVETAKAITGKGTPPPPGM